MLHMKQISFTIIFASAVLEQRHFASKQALHCDLLVQVLAKKILAVRLILISHSTNDIPTSILLVGDCRASH